MESSTYKIPTSSIERFWSKVEKRGPDECWPWKAATNQAGYGVFSVGAKTAISSRLAYALSAGEAPPAGLLVMHSCDNPPCCNPSHLSLGTNKDNILDSLAKGRFRPRSSLWPVPPASIKKDRNHPNREAIRAALKEMNCREIAEKFGASIQLVWKISGESPERKRRILRKVAP